jgi:hypothetical protein
MSAKEIKPEMDFPKIFPFRLLPVKDNWMMAWKYPAFRWQLTITLAVMTFFVLFIPIFFSFIQLRQGYQLHDSVLNRITVRNMSLYTFLIIYVVIITATFSLSLHPALFLKFLQAYCILITMRIFSLYFLALEPEQSIIPLQDPLLDYFFYSGHVITKDLFFSGHVSTMFLIFLAIQNRSLKYYFLAATVIVAVFIMIQHVHYTIDIIAAPLFSWISYRIAQWLPLDISYKEIAPVRIIKFKRKKTNIPQVQQPISKPEFEEPR